MIDTKSKIVGSMFVTFEAIMHVYLVIYLISQKSSVLAIGFTVFELTMFCYLLFERKVMHKEVGHDGRL